MPVPPRCPFHTTLQIIPLLSNAQSWGRCCGLLKVASCLTLGVFFPFDKHQALAEVTPDTTLGAERSRVTPDAQVRGGLADLIEGGAERGANLFHSFTDFNVEELQRVYFANPAGIENIISRVTGTNPSSILGTLGVDGAANLFLLNPHGIIFGANAQLDIQGSFVASTANSITFGDGSSFSANPDNSSLLTVSVPLGLQYGTNQAGAIANAGNLAVGSGQTLSLSGGTVTSTGSLTAAGGRVEVLGNQVSLLDNARIDVSSDTGGGTVLIGGDFQGNGTVPNAVHTFVGSDVTINADALTNGDGGKVIVWADQTASVHGTLTARGGTVFGDGGFIETSGQQFLNLTSTPDASAPNGSGGTWLIDPTDITLANGGGAIGTNTVDVANINAALNTGTNVTISTSIGGTDQGNITQNNDAPISKTAGGDATLTLQAENDIFLFADITSNSGQLNIELLADSDNSGAGAIGIFNATIDTNGGNFSSLGRGTTNSNGWGHHLNNANINAGGGNLKLEGTGIADGTGNGIGIFLENSELKTTGLGTITLIGNGGIGGDDSIGVDVTNNTIISSENGDIRLTGTGKGFNNGRGIQIRDNGLVRSTGTGNIFLSGTTTGTGSDNYGILIREQFAGGPSVVEATGTGNITLVGINNGIGTDGNHGISIRSGSRVSATTGNLSLTGTGNGTGSGNTGIFINSGSVIQSTGTGAITLEGTSAAGTSENQGIRIYGNGSRVSGKDGNITLTGTAAPSNGDLNHGIYILNRGLVQSTGAGSIEITGTANASSNVGFGNEGISIVAGGGVESTGTGMITMTGNGGNGGIGSDGDQGIVVLGSNTRVTSVDGDILLRGISRGTGTNNYGIWLGAAGGGVVRTTGTGNITLEGIIRGIGNNSEGIFFGNGGAIEAIGKRSLILNALGDINTKDISNPSGSITLTSTNGSIDTTAGIISTFSFGSGGDITLSADGDLNLGPIDSRGRNVAGGDITLTSTNGSIDTTAGSLSTYSFGSGGDITLSADGDLNLGSLDSSSLDSSGRDVAGGNITLNSNGAIIAKNQRIISETRGSVKAGDINIKAQSVSFTGTRVSTITRGDGLGGNLNINASDSINITNGSQLLVQTLGNGDAGNATINTQQLVVQNDRPELNRYTGIGTETLSSGNAGNLTINASESVKLIGNQSIVFNPNLLDPDSILQAVETATGLTTATFGTGDGGTLSLTTRSLVIQNGAGIISGPVLSDENDAQGTLPEGKGGELSITATESIEIQGQAGILTGTLGNGDAGNLFLNSGRIILEEGATISADTIIGPVATSADTIIDSVPTFINASGNAGDITIETNQLSIRSGSRIGAATTNRGEGGNITINASEFIEVTGLSKDGEVPSTISTELLEGSTGPAGDLKITTSNLTITDRGQISAQSEGEGDAGNININVSDRLTATDGNIITATTQSAGGAIDITAKDIRLRGDSDITTSVFSGADNGGNITITTDSLIAFADSDILAFARDGRGGDITFKTPIFFGFAFRPAPKGTDPATLDNNNRVDINASGAIDGVITLPNLDFIENSLTELPDNLIDTDNLLANSCIVRTSEQEGQFIITGGGNLPTRPGDASVSRYPTGEVRTVPSESASRPWQKGDPIVEATGVYQLPNGRLVMGRECS
ncbi:filamentous hemagglutinin N-terminal domain-containing protein [Moorena sp. SIO4A5]|uniref:beta strand repeat-containing protein n=1 Tax=Moorena sp. SIO4A5 TaxID=2607838 RepID=UPI0013C5C8B0|nr:filamentous hemagglutinin N-terminal domain-containing protein [Moorena sp. SIO4A5]NEO19421.1 filamentous hemagglutinin N-terminal domain-containing protein [Moorena sp. SIO4A5]